MPVPKRKTSKSKRDKRRTHQKIAGPDVSECPQCGDAKLPHRVCPSCGSYKGREIINTDKD
jgi:large subunit ribosomal protein L32